MDTSLGRDNQNRDVSHFAFSDYWQTKAEEVTDEFGNICNKLDKAVIYRDYQPSADELGGAIWGYDVPSSYLFALVKYARAINSDSGTDLPYPQQTYAEWRCKGRPLESADTFINNYFQKHLSQVPDILISLNYREKYLYDIVPSSTHTAFKNENKLTGKRVEKTRE